MADRFGVLSISGLQIGDTGVSPVFKNTLHTPNTPMRSYIYENSVTHFNSEVKLNVYVDDLQPLTSIVRTKDKRLIVPGLMLTFTV